MTICRLNINDAGLPFRIDVILQREKNMFPMMVTGLQGNRKGMPAKNPELTIGMIERAFESQNILIMANAAFLAGRCQADIPGFHDRMVGLLKKLLDSISEDDLDVKAPAYIQSAMSLALLGETEIARQALTPLVKEKAAMISESYLAAYYLAQMGDPSGYPVILKSLSGNNEHFRLMAMRYLVGFKPYQGQTIQGKTVDILNELIQRLNDKSDYVRQEVPYLLAEAGAENLKEILLPVAKSHKDKNVRQAALDILEEL
jgi:hypothetical protein